MIELAHPLVRWPAKMVVVYTVAQVSRGSDRLAIDGYGGLLDWRDPGPRSVQYDSGVLAEYVLSLKNDTVALIGADRVFPIDH